MTRAKYIKSMTLITSTAIALSLCGCGKDKGPTIEEVQAENQVMLGMIAEKDTQIEQLNNTVQSLLGSDGPPTAISEVADGTGQKTFNSIGGKIIFPTNLEYKGSVQGPNTSSIKLSDRISIVPSDNWVIQINGTTTKYSHPNGIYGTIKVSAIQESFKNDVINDEVLSPFLDSIPSTKCEKGTVYLEQTERGMYADLNILNNGKPAVLKCGVMGYMDTAMVYTFYYEGDYDSTKDELINSLLKTIKIGQQQLRIE